MTEVSSAENIKGSVKANSILVTGLFTGVVIFVLIVGVVINLNGRLLEDAGMDKIFLSVASVIAVICLWVAIARYKKKTREITSTVFLLPGKLANYRIALIG